MPTYLVARNAQGSTLNRGDVVTVGASVVQTPTTVPSTIRVATQIPVRLLVYAPGGERVPTIVKALSGSASGVPLGVVVGAFDGGTSAADDALTVVQTEGFLDYELAGSPSTNAPVYVSDTGTLSLTPGTGGETVGHVHETETGMWRAWLGNGSSNSSVPFDGPGLMEVASNSTLAFDFDFSRGGRIRPALGAAVAYTGRFSLPPNRYAFDVSLGGTHQIDQTCIDQLTPYNFGASLDAVREDSVEWRAWLAACQWEAGDATGGIVAYMPPGRALVGATMEQDERGDWVLARLNKTGSHLKAAGRAISSIRFNPTEAAGPQFICLRMEEQPSSEPTLYQTVEGLQFGANGDTTRKKIAIDAHDIRRMLLKELTVATWTDTSNATGTGSIGFRIRGRDASVIEDCFLDCDLPIYFDHNDVETEPLDADGFPTVYRDDSQKDIDHITLSRLVLNCDNVYEKNVLFRPGVVFRNIKFEGDFTWVDGGLACVDRLDSGGIPWAGADVIPRRQSNFLYIGDGRQEGNASADSWSVQIERHPIAPLQELVIDGLLMAEGYDCRRNALVGGVTGLTGGRWKGFKLAGVKRATIRSGTRYHGSNIPFEVDDECVLTIEPGAELIPTEQLRRWPEHSSHFDFIRNYLGHSTFLGFDHWWNLFADDDDPHDDLQTAGTDFNLDPSGSPNERQLLDDWFRQRYWVQFTEAANQKLRLNSADASLDPATHSVAACGVVLLDSTWTPGGDRALCNLAGDTTGPILRVNTSGQLYIRANGVDGSPSGLDFLDDQPFIYFFAHDRTATTLTCWIRKFDGTEDTITGTYFASPGNAVDKGFGPFSSGTSSFRGWMTWAAWALDAKAEQDASDVFDALGWV